MKNIRMCVACRARKEKNELLRIISKDKEAVIDENKKTNTRGIYICNDKTCINKLLRSKNLVKCIKLDVTVDSIIELLRNLEE